jgi:hypothetical protein
MKRRDFFVGLGGTAVSSWLPIRSALAQKVPRIPGRPSDPATDTIRDGDQSQNRKSAWARNRTDTLARADEVIE